MGSRIRNDVDRLYLCFCKIAQPKSPDKEAHIIEKFPEEYYDDQVLNSIPKFAYPCEIENSNIQHFSFVLTEANSKWTFGFCRLDPKTETALVFLSHLPWLEVFVKVLNSVAELIKNSKFEALKYFLSVLYDSRVPSPGTTLTVTYDNDTTTLFLQSPSQFQLPSIPQNRNLTEYYNAIDVNNMLVIFASMLYERRIIFKSKRLLRLSACVQAANAVIYPMHWQHIYIPVLPMHLIDYLLAPMPFLIGVPTSIWENVRKSDLGDVVVLDADTNSLQTPFNDIELLPHDVVKFLRTQLKAKSTLVGDGLARTFLKALVQLIGGYRDALKFQQGQRITFSEEAFVQSRPSNMQSFLKDVLHLQIFQQFIEERLDLLNTGMGFSDEFEREACNYIGKSSSKIKAQYKEYLATMRMQGSAFLKTFKNKANPAVKSAVKSVREKGKDVKTAYKGIRSKMKRETTFFYEHSNKMGLPQPRSAPSSPTSNRNPLRFSQKPMSVSASYKKQIISLTQAKRSNEYAPLKQPSEDLISTSSETDVASKSDVLPHLNMDLMEDLKEVINRQFPINEKTQRSSPTPFRNLKSVRSLDAFQSNNSSGSSLARMGSVHQINNSHSHLSPTFSLPISQKSSTIDISNLNPLSFDPFGFSTNFSLKSEDVKTVCNGTNPFTNNLAQNSSKPNNSLHIKQNSDVFNFPAPHSVPEANIKQFKGTGSVDDLIRLDSIPPENCFDPLDSSGTSSSNDSIPFKTGLTNPLYPYYSLNSKNNNTDNKLFNSAMNSNLTYFQNTSNAVISRCSEQDLDLLKEYDLNFTSNTNNCQILNVNKASNPFELNLDNPRITTKKDVQNNWATFD